MAQQSPPIFDYLSDPRFIDFERNRINIPISLPRFKRTTTMAHADFIANALSKEIREYRMKSFDNFAIDVKIYPVPSAREFYDKKQRWIGFSQYYFEAFGEATKAMFVTVDYDWSVKIKYLGAWRPICAYLKNLKPHNAWDDSMPKADIIPLRWRQQADWWKDNGKVFPLMELPRELRDIVFEHTWGPIIEPYPTNSARKLTKLGKMKKKLQTPSANIVRTGHQIAAEATDILYMRTPFLFQHYGVLKAFTCNVVQRKLIRHVALAFSHDDLMHLFGTDHVRKDKKTKTETIGFGHPALALRGTILNSLTIVIAPPSLTTKTGKFDGACQRVAVDMIMEAAWTIVRGHPLELTGYIKDDQKRIYEARGVLERKRVQAWRKKRAGWGLPDGSLEEYAEELDEQVGGVPLSGARLETAQEDFPAPEYDLKCHCDPPCTEETWTPWQ